MVGPIDSLARAYMSGNSAPPASRIAQKLPAPRARARTATGNPPILDASRGERLQNPKRGKGSGKERQTRRIFGGRLRTFGGQAIRLAPLTAPGAPGRLVSATLAALIRR